MNGKPKACPFCGSTDAYLSEQDDVIICPNCLAKGPTDWDAFGEAFAGNTELIPQEMWDRRQLPEQHDVTPTVPGWYWMKRVVFGTTIQKVIEISEMDVLKKGFVYFYKSSGIREYVPFSDCQFYGPITPPARWNEEAGDSHRPHGDAP